MDLRQRLLATFRVEYSEHVSRIRDLLAGFEAAGAAAPGLELDETFRRAHSLKGAARAVDLRDLEALAHRMEAVLARLREGSQALRSDTLAALVLALDTGDDLMAALARSEAAPDVTPALLALDRALTPGDAAPEAEATPPPAGTADGGGPEKRAEAAIPPAASLEAAPETVRIPVHVLDRLLRVAGLLHTEALRREQLSQDARELTERLLTLEAQSRRMRQSSGVAGVRQATAASESQSEFLHEELQCCVRQHAALSSAQRQADWQLRQLDEQLQEQVRLARLVPVESVFGGFRQMARELARDLGKEVQLRLSGFDVQADRSVLQELKDPVMHLLRNAIDHGLEEPAARERAGKPRIGELRLSMKAGAGRLTLHVSDDGRGLDLEQVRSSVVRRNRLTPVEAQALSPEELGRWIFEPGFSTTRFVTDLSGRGMGLSIVAEAVSRLGGDYAAQPGPHGGLEVRVTVPLAVATVPLMVVRAAGQAFGLPASSIQRLLHVRVEELGRLEGQPAIRWEEQHVPLASLAHLLGIGDAELYTEDPYLLVAVLSVAGVRIGLVVDAFEAHTEAVLHDLGAPFASLSHLTGGFVSAGEEIVLALNPSALLERYLRGAGEPQIRIVQPEPAVAARVLVVDDSITTRTLEKSLLEAHGYQVQVAVDGVEALSLLRQERPDLVIADVEMPRLDGFGLLEAIRKDPELRAVPVIMVTSLDQREHRQRGLDLGADAYIIKQHFDQSALLETIRRLL
jgi:two-component system chemotaxis sensor kinase CheA